MASLFRSVSKAIALVTGGASGLGRATASRLAEQGASVIIADLPGSQGEEAAKVIGEKCTFVPTDVRTYVTGNAVGIVHVAEHVAMILLSKN